LFCDVAQPVSRATVAAVVSYLERDQSSSREFIIVVKLIKKITTLSAEYCNMPSDANQTNMGIVASGGADIHRCCRCLEFVLKNSDASLISFAFSARARPLALL
jgi:hypothetical protein